MCRCTQILCFDLDLGGRDSVGTFALNFAALAHQTLDAFRRIDGPLPTARCNFLYGEADATMKVMCIYCHFSSPTQWHNVSCHGSVTQFAAHNINLRNGFRRLPKTPDPCSETTSVLRRKEKRLKLCRAHDKAHGRLDNN